MNRRYTVACLAGDGIGPELMAEASRSIAAVSRFHGFTVEEVHVPFGGEALTRSGHLLPVTTRAAYLAADAVLVASAGEPALEGVESELDLRARLTQVRFEPEGDVVLLSPLEADADEWTLERAFAVARSRRCRVASVYQDRRWLDLAEEAAGRHDGLQVDHLSVSEALPALAFETERFDVVVSGMLFADALADVAASPERSPRVVATGRLSDNGPGVFAPSHGSATDIAGQGVANPSSVLLAASLLLGEGLGEQAAGETLSGAVTAARRNVRTPDLLRVGVAATTREFMEVVLAGLPGAVRNAEFYRAAS